jgi:putative transposase
MSCSIHRKDQLMSKRIEQIKLDALEKEHLEKIVNKRTSPQQMVLRAKIILMTSKGISAGEITEKLDTSKVTVSKWKKRFLENGLDGLMDQPRPGRSVKYGPEIRHKIAAEACNPPPGRTHWTIRDLAKHMNVDRGIVERVFKDETIKPHRIKYYHHSTDPEFETKMLNIVGLYLEPPDNAVVLSVDEKTGIQALDRTQPVLPLQPHGKIKNIPFEYKRLGTTSLLAALDVHSGTVHGQFEDRHRHQEFLSFLVRLEKTYRKKGRQIHIICDNYSAHKHSKVKEWADSHENIFIHFTPTHASWLNQIELWFSIMSRRVLKQGIFKSVKDLINKIEKFINEYNQSAEPFAWTYTGQPLKVK